MRARRPLISTSLVAAVLASVIFSAGAQAAPGDLDPTFSGDGKQTADFPFGVSTATATTRQPDGKIITVGSVLRSTSGDTSTWNFAVARFRPDGMLDTTFSGDGKTTTGFGSDSDSQAAAVALQADGKIVVVGMDGFGSPFGSNYDFAIARYNPNGSLDPSFSGDGKQTAQLGNDGRANGIAVQGDGKIVAVGSNCIGLHPDVTCDLALARFNSDGSLDTSFSGDGRQTTDFGSVRDQANGVALQTDGKIMAVGQGGPSPGDFALARYNPDGSLDTSFSGDGKQTADFGSSDQANAVVVQGDSKIVVGGSGGPGGAFARYTPNGSLDLTFSGDGKKTTDFLAANDLALQADGKIVAVGGSDGDFAAVRYHPDGTPDRAFSGDGRQTTDFGGRFDAARGVALQGDGKIVAVGRAGGHDDAFGLVRYNPNGSLDPSFSGDGKQRAGFGGYKDGALAVAVQDDGKVLAAGYAGGIYTDFAVARYKPNGTLDPGFSGEGKQTTDFGGDDEAAAVAVQANGKIVVVGKGHPRGIGFESTFALARYDPDGSLDPSFDGNGKQTTAMGASGSWATGVAIQPNGKIVVVGFGYGGSTVDFEIARYNPNGSLDTTFSGDGKQVTDFGGEDWATGVSIQGDGRIVAVGVGGTASSGSNFALARYNPSGSLDTTFSGDGKQTTDFGGPVDQANGVAIQANGRILAVGAGGAGGALARYNLNGTLDMTFSGDGKQTTDFVEPTGVALQGNSRIVVVGRAPGTFALARYNPSGALDLTFSGDGKQTTDFGEPSQHPGGAYGVALQTDGKIVAVGIGPGPNLTDDFALARYLGG